MTEETYCAIVAVSLFLLSRLMEKILLNKEGIRYFLENLKN